MKKYTSDDETVIGVSVKKNKKQNVKPVLVKAEKTAYDFINTRLKPKVILNDGKQTPMRQVHPVFIAQHATGTCCRSCLYKWHGIEKNKELSQIEVDYIVSVISEWINNEIK